MTNYKFNNKIAAIIPGTEVGGNRILCVVTFYDKSFNHCGIYIGINPKGTYRLFSSDSSGILYKIKGKYTKMKTALLEMMNHIRTDCRLNHE